MKCKICNSQSNDFATAQVLNKYDINYFQCLNCGFVQTEEPYWLEEAYSNAIAMSDVGLVFRNLMFSDLTSTLIFNFFDHNSKFLDYGAGYGLFVRLMRDKGFDFYWFDKFCKNLFAQDFEIDLDKKENHQFELITAFEVFEHLVNPNIELENLLKISPNILLSTELIPPNNPKPNDWWYYVLHEGQHISIYTHHSLQILAEKYNLNFYSNGSSLHLLTEKKFFCNPFEELSRNQLKRPEKTSLISQDFNNIIQKYFQPNQVNSINTEALLFPSLQESKLNRPLNIIVDGVFFQMFKTGIARVWQSLLSKWSANGFSQNIIVLDRVGTSPKISGIRYLSVPAYDYSNTDNDCQMLQEICDQEQADLFISTYYTTPISTPSVFMAYDMIPEILGANLDEPMWREKHRGITHASAYISISQSTANDLVKYFPDIDSKVTVAHCGISSSFYPAPISEIIQFKAKYGISKPYFLLVGAGSDYKNAILFFQGFAQLTSKTGFDVVCTGTGYLLSSEYRELVAGSIVHSLYLSDEELRSAYSGATALVYPSKYEGFGMPVAEALACGCPVITCPNSSIPEVAGEAAIYINDDDIDAMTDALCEVQKIKLANTLIAKGLEQAKKFSWSNMANQVSSALINATLLHLNLREINLVIFPDWSQPEGMIYPELARIIKASATHPNRRQMTLLIDHHGISDEDADLALSSVMMNLLMEEKLDLDNSVEIALIGQLNSTQWSALRSQLQGRIQLNVENQATIVQVEAEHLPAYSIETLEALFS